MRTLIVGDIHIKAAEILPRVDMFLEDNPDISRIVFTGDYCDDWTASDDMFRRDIEELAEWVEDMRESGYKVDLVFGNHDFQYLLGRPGPGTKKALYAFVRETLFPLGLRIAEVVDGYLLTHAGLTQSWADKFLDEPLDADTAASQLNAMLDSGDARTLDFLDMCGYGRGGLEIPSPLWADKWELEEDPVESISQIVGHTPVGTSEKTDVLFEDGIELWFCDTFSTTSYGFPIGDGSVLVSGDGKVKKVFLPEA